MLCTICHHPRCIYYHDRDDPSIRYAAADVWALFVPDRPIPRAFPGLAFHQAHKEVGVFQPGLLAHVVQHDPAPERVAVLEAWPHLAAYYPLVLTHNAYRDPFGACIPLQLTALYVEAALVAWWHTVPRTPNTPEGAA